MSTKTGCRKRGKSAPSKRGGKCGKRLKHHRHKKR